MWRHQPRLTQFEYGQCESAVNRERNRAIGSGSGDDDGGGGGSLEQTKRER